MKRILLLLPIAVLCASAASFADKRYSIDQVRIHASIDSTGGVWIQESRTYSFTGHFTKARYDLPLSGIADMTDISVAEAGRDYREVDGGADETTPGTFRVERDKRAVTIYWYYDADDEPRTFDLRFYLKGVAIAHADVAEFYYKFIGTGWDHASGTVEATVQLPGVVPVSDMKIWAHGPLHGTCAIVAPGIARFDIAPLPADTYWEGRVVFPVRFLPAALSRTQRNALPRILDVESEWAEEANRVRETAIRRAEERSAWRRQNVPWLIAANIAGVMALFYLYNRYGRSLVPAHRRLQVSPPEDLPPVLANYYYAGQQLSAGALVSTVVDLARRGYVSISEGIRDARFLTWRWKKKEYILRFHERKSGDGRSGFQTDSGLQPHEEEFLRYLRSEVAQGADSIPFSAIAKSRNTFMRWYATWRSQVKRLVPHKYYYDSQSIRIAFIGFAGMLLLVGLGILAIVKMGEAGIAFIFSGAILAGLPFVIIRYSTETARERGRILGFRDYLKRLAKNQGSITWNVQTLEPVLVYALAVDFPSHLLKTFLERFPSSQGATFYPWYIHSEHGVGGFAEAMASMASAASTAMSSASGAGGGASGGGGGGAGGSGGGAG